MANATILKGGTGKDDIHKNFFASALSATSIRVHPMCWFGRAMALRVEVFQCLNEFTWKSLETTLAVKATKDATELGESSHNQLSQANYQGLSQGRRGEGLVVSEGSFEMEAGNRAGNSEDDEDDMGSGLDSATAVPKASPEKLVIEARTATQKAESGSMPSCSVILEATKSAFEQWTLGMGGSGAIYQTEAHRISVGGKEYTFHAYQRRVVSGAGLLQKRLVCYTTGEGKEFCCVGKDSKALAGVWPQQVLQTKLM